MADVRITRAFDWDSRVLWEAGVHHRMFGWPGSFAYGGHVSPSPSDSSILDPPGWLIPDHQIATAIVAFIGTGLQPCPMRNFCPSMVDLYLPPTELPHFHRRDRRGRENVHSRSPLYVIRLYKVSQYQWYSLWQGTATD